MTKLQLLVVDCLCGSISESTSLICSECCLNDDLLSNSSLLDGLTNYFFFDLLAFVLLINGCSCGAALTSLKFER